MRQLKFHEKKLLKKVDFINWKLDNNIHIHKIIRRYRLKNQDEYASYNRLALAVRELAKKIRDLDPKDKFRVDAGTQLLEKLYSLGIIPTKRGLDLCDTVTASSFCRRRLPIVLKNLKMAEHMDAAMSFVEHGHVRVGPELILDPAFLVSRNMEDYITWTNHSKIRKHIMAYNNTLDDFDMAA